jgi:C-terminal processing protease CtpA/Prc
MLNSIKNDIKKNYYDPTFHGVDLEARFKAAEQKLNEATSLGQLFGIIGQAVLDLNDSHTVFLPPQRTTRTDYGWVMQAIGDKCFVTAIKPGSEAEKKGLKPGDLVHSVNGFAPSRENLWKMQYLFYTIRPQPLLRVQVQSPGEQPREIDIPAKITQGKRIIDLAGPGASLDVNDLLREAENEDRLNAHRYIEMGEDLFIWKMPQFDLEQGSVDSMMDKARKRKALILDLRGNGGGSEETLLRMIGNLVDHDVKVGDLKRRKENKPLLAKTRGKDRFSGQLVVLIDSKSGSSSELLARITQLEKRGSVIGDHSAGAVMRSRIHSYQSGADVQIFYAASITDADIVMTDGKSLENTGVTPDELLLPTAEDLAAGRDPVMVRAAAIVGIKLDPLRAGKMFPVQWRK